MKLPSLLLAALLFGCATPTAPVPPPAPPFPQQWTNAARLPEGQIASGIAIYLVRPADAALTAKLVAAHAVKRSEMAWTIDPFNRLLPEHRAALEGAGRASAITGPYWKP